MTDKPAEPAGKPDDEPKPVTGETPAADAVASAAADDTASGADSVSSATTTPETAATTEPDRADRATSEGTGPARSAPSAGESAGSATATANTEAEVPETTDSDTAPSDPVTAGVGPSESTARAPENGSAAAGSAPEHGKTVSMKKLLGGRRTSGSGGAPERAGSGSRPRVLLGALAVAVLLLIGAVGVAGYLYVEERDKAEVLAAYDEVRQAACRYAPVLANYDAKNLEPYFSAVLDGATGDWKKEFETTTTELREALAAGQVVSTAGDIQCAVKTVDAGSAEVVVVIGQTITSLGTQGQPAPGQLAMVMRMQKTDGRWLVDQMTSPLAEPVQ
ncbi:hypothetical protein [Nocardia carnea]|uniref:Mce-associated membrane protein n=1 Tax=Nocardia carnea TaxID=37328 RepID=A0ABW7TUL7_9NOCA|nr:hypothetical protein [Nocardia carnea]